MPGFDTCLNAPVVLDVDDNERLMGFIYTFLGTVFLKKD
jgi:hypothetical protein